MEVFAIIIFGLATVRTIVPFAQNVMWRKLTDLIPNFIIAGTMVWCYIWFINLLLNIA